MNSVPWVLCSINSLPVCLQNAAKSLFEPLSVETTLRSCPDCIDDRDFLAFKIGSGQFRPLVSSSTSTIILISTFSFGGELVNTLYFFPFKKTRLNGFCF